jgi:glycosyltransferase involved in cell wall biosynthesis
MKNLGFAIRVIGSTGEGASLDVYGPLEDQAYWRSCEALANESGITMSYRGEVEHVNVPAVLSRYHLFILPTLGENFGHAILEALSAGRPVLISDGTPWRGLSKAGAGWELSLNDFSSWSNAIDEVIRADQLAFDALCDGAYELAGRISANDRAVEEHIELFNVALTGR